MEHGLENELPITSNYNRSTGIEIYIEVFGFSGPDGEFSPCDLTGGYFQTTLRLAGELQRVHAVVGRKNHAISRIAWRRRALVSGDGSIVRCQEYSDLLISACLDLLLRPKHGQKTLRACLRQQVHLFRAILQIRSQIDPAGIICTGIRAAVDFHIGHSHEHVAVRTAGRRTGGRIADRGIHESSRGTASSSATTDEHEDNCNYGHTERHQDRARHRYPLEMNDGN